MAETRNELQAEVLRFIETYCLQAFPEKPGAQAERYQELWRIGPIDLLYLFRHLEERHHIQFTEEEYDNPDFYTLTGLVSAIRQKMSSRV